MLALVLAGRAWMPAGVAQRLAFAAWFAWFAWAAWRLPRAG